MLQMLVCLKLSQRLLTLSSFFEYFFLFAILIGCFCFLIFQLVSCTLLLILCKLFFTSVSVSFISVWFFFMVSMSFFMLWKFSLSSSTLPLSLLSIIITRVLNSASSRLLVSIWLCSFSGVLFFYLEYISLSPHFGSLSV